MDTRDISIVIQGAVDKINTPKCVKSLRKYFPGSQIIVSTWEGTNINALDADDFILSKDPGGFRVNFARHLLIIHCVRLFLRKPELHEQRASIF